MTNTATNTVTDRQPSVTLRDVARLLLDEGLLVRVAIDGAPVGIDALPGTEVSGCDCDSRVAAPGHLFVCKGQAFRPAYLASAVAAGAVAYVCEEPLADGLSAVAPQAPALVVSDVRAAASVVSPAAWGWPDEGITIVGITGTKGKSTTACMLREILDAAGGEGSTAIIGSIETWDGVERFESVNTTPEPPDLWRHLANARRAGIRHLVMEVSSHALKYGRVHGLHIDVACFLNIGRDHISPVEHADFDDYLESKKRIFALADMAVVNVDMGHAEEVLDAALACRRVVTTSSVGGARRVGSRDVAVDAWASDVQAGGGAVSFLSHSRIGGAMRELPVTIPFPGLFNVENALVAIAACDLLGVAPRDVVEGIARTRVPGRTKVLRADGGDITCLVDYAHNRLSYQRLFPSVAEEFPGREVVVVLGAPGGKAHERRRELPEEAAKWADLLIYTEEDPAGEDPADICAEMAANTPAGTRCKVIVDREEAIAFAVAHARSCGRPALVCLLAKGDETRQHRGDEFVPMRPDAEVFLDAAGRGRG